jgi:hypothetical protein
MLGQEPVEPVERGVVYALWTLDCIGHPGQQVIVRSDACQRQAGDRLHVWWRPSGLES